MRSISKLFNFFAKLYKVFGILLGAFAVIVVVIFALVRIAMVSGTEFGTHLLGASLDPKFESAFSFQYNIQVVFVASLAAAFFFLNALIFRDLKRFIDAKNSKQDFKTQKATLRRIPSYLIGTFVYGLLSLFYSQQEEAIGASWLTIEFALDAFFAVVPMFHGPVALVIAMIIFLYQKSLTEQETLSAETMRLKQEAEFVI